MNRVTVNLNALQHNLQRIRERMEHHGASWSVVTKALCGHTETLRALHAMGVRSMADSRLDNLSAMAAALPDVERWYLRPPLLSAVREVVRLTDLSLNSEVEVIRALNREALRQGKIHRIIIMVELGDLREGVLPGGLTRFFEAVHKLPNIETVGIGAQVGCLSGIAPDRDQLDQLLLYRELLELKFDCRLPLISAGSSIFLPALRDGIVPTAVNHYRIGEALLLGTDLLHGGVLEGFRDDAFTIEAEVVEVREKSLVPSGTQVDSAPFDALVDGAGDTHPSPGPQRGYRALVALGQLDIEVSGLSPATDGFEIAGASSDITAVNLGDDRGDLHLGDAIAFRPDYGALVRIMNNPSVAKQVCPSLQELQAAWADDGPDEMPAALELDWVA